MKRYASAYPGSMFEQPYDPVMESCRYVLASEAEADARRRERAAFVAGWGEYHYLSYGAPMNAMERSDIKIRASNRYPEEVSHG